MHSPFEKCAEQKKERGFYRKAICPSYKIRARVLNDFAVAASVPAAKGFYSSPSLPPRLCLIRGLGSFTIDANNAPNRFGSVSYPFAKVNRTVCT